MIGIVRTALARPLTFIVMAILILVMGVLAALRAPVDIFPDIRVPVIATAWTYAGLTPEDMAGRVISPHERSLMTTVNDTDHIERRSMQDVGNATAAQNTERTLLTLQIQQRQTAADLVRALGGLNAESAPDGDCGLPS